MEALQNIVGVLDACWNSVKGFMEGPLGQTRVFGETSQGR